jgi:hypothetical protein
MHLKYQKYNRTPCTVSEIYDCRSQSFIRWQSEGRRVGLVSAARLVLFRHSWQCLWVGLLALYGGIIKFSFSFSFIPSGYSFLLYIVCCLPLIKLNASCTYKCSSLIGYQIIQNSFLLGSS